MKNKSQKITFVMIVIGRIEMCVVSIGLWLVQILLLYLAHQLILARGLVADLNGVIKCRLLVVVG